MRKLIMFNMMSLDGFFEGPDHDLGWHHTDEEFNTFANEQLSNTGTLIFGRKTYQMMAEFWQSATAAQQEPATTGWMNLLPKIVASTTLERASWKNTRLIKANVESEIRQLKDKDGQNLFLFGSANLAASLRHENLIDEYRIMLNPVVLGKGTPLFNHGIEKTSLKLTRCRNFKNGNVLLTYEPC